MKSSVSSCCVVLLHGLARTRRSMTPMARYLERNGIDTINLGYPSTRMRIEDLAEELRPKVLAESQRRDRLCFVTHSMGGIVLRQMHAAQPIPRIARVVMLSPPNRGSQIVDRIGHWPLFNWVNGPAGRQLVTGEEGLPERLGPVDFELGVITGTRSFDPIFSRMLPNPNDGKVAASHAVAKGQRALLQIAATHTFMMRNKEVMENTLAFLRDGAFLNPQ